jgi:hypothetical protein
MVAVAEDQSVLATYSAVASRFRCGSVTVRAGQITDVYAVPEVQGKHIFTRCYEAFIERFGNPHHLPLMYGFPTERHYEMGLNILKYVPLGPVPCLRHAGGGRFSLSLPGRVRTGFDRQAADDLWYRAQHRYTFGTVRDGAWLERRYAGRRGVDYVHISVWRSGRRRRAWCARWVSGSSGSSWYGTAFTRAHWRRCREPW